MALLSVQTVTADTGKPWSPLNHQPREKDDAAYLSAE
jgi:hypothetical protein